MLFLGRKVEEGMVWCWPTTNSF